MLASFLKVLFEQQLNRIGYCIFGLLASFRHHSSILPNIMPPGWWHSVKSLGKAG